MEYREKRVCTLNDKGEIIKEEIVKKPVITEEYLKAFFSVSRLLKAHTLDRLVENMKPLPFAIAKCRDWCIKNNVELKDFQIKDIDSVLIDYGY